MENYSNKTQRTSWAITLSVWSALFLRETTTRLAAGRGAGVWLLLEPIIQTAVMMFIFTVIRIKTVSGIDTLAWLIIGFTFMAVYKRTEAQVQNGINANKVLLNYRQVKPIDTLLSRAFLEGFLELVLIIITSAGAIFLLDVNLIPESIDKLYLAFLGLWLMGLGYGLIASVAIELVPELSKILGFLSAPIFMTSGAFMPIQTFPEPYRSWMLYNPLVHGLEFARSGISSYYHVVHGVNVSYLFQCAFVAVFLGLALHIRFSSKFLTQ